MLNTLLFELILLALTIISPGMDKGEFKMESGKEKINISFVKTVEGFDEEHQMIRYDVTLSSPKESEDLLIVYEMIDNGLYRVTIGTEEPFDLDMVGYFIQLDWQEKATKKQTIQDSFQERLVLQPKKNTLEINSKNSRIKIIIPRAYFD